MKLPRITVPLWRRRTVLVAVGLLAVAGLGATVVATTVSNAEPIPAAVTPLPPEFRNAFIEAARSCPALSPAKLAGQVMEESHFSMSALNSRGGLGIAGMSDAVWRTWQPWPGADSMDPRANILALAHQVCDLVGQVRVAGVSGDSWHLAVGAFYSGLAALKAAGGVPDAARAYVDRVAGYTTLYASEFGAPLDPATTPVPAASTPSPTATANATATVTVSPSVKAATASRVTPTPSTLASAPTVAPRLTGGALTNDEFNECLSATNAENGTQLTVAKCDGSPIQRWQAMPDGTIRSVGLCMDAANAATDDFTPVQVATCSGNPAQLFTLDRSQHLINSNADKCVNIHWTSDGGTSVVLFSCLDQTNQIWKFKEQ